MELGRNGQRVIHAGTHGDGGVGPAKRVPLSQLPPETGTSYCSKQRAPACDPESVRATGAGEAFIRVGVAHEICTRLRLGGAIGPVVDEVLAEVRALGGTGGVIVVTPDGTPHWGFNTPGMYRGRVSAEGEPLVAIYGDEER